MTLRRIATNLGVVVASVSLVSLAAELVTRAVGCASGVDFSLYAVELENPDRLPKQLFVEAPATGVRLRPNTQVLATTSDFSVSYRINQFGHRDRDHDRDKPPGVVRILALGDSMTFGEGVPYGGRYTDVAEDALEGLEIINTGVPGWGLDQELVYLATDGIQWNPDVVLFFVSKAQERRYNLRLIRHGEVAWPNPSDPEPAGVPTVGAQYVERRPGSASALRFSRLLSYLHYRIRVTALRQRFAEADRRVWEEIQTNSRPRGEQAGRTASSSRRFFELRSLRLLEAAGDLGRRYGFRVAAINIDSHELPWVNQLAPEITYHSLAPLLAREEAQRNIRFVYDRHYNPRTHRQMGQAVAEIICTGFPGLRCDGGRVRSTNEALPAPSVRPDVDGRRWAFDSPVPRARAEQLVNAAYRALLARPPSAAERPWIDRVEARRAAAGKMVQEIMTLDEYRQRWENQRLVASLYLGVLGRPPDASGFDHYVSALADGRGPEQLLHDWADGEEWQAAFGELDHEGFVRRLSRGLLGREPDALELATWAPEAAEGPERRRRLILETLLVDPEAIDHLEPELLPIMLDLAFRDQLPPDSELEVTAGRLHLGEPAAYVIADFLDGVVPGP